MAVTTPRATPREDGKSHSSIAPFLEKRDILSILHLASEAYRLHRVQYRPLGGGGRRRYKALHFSGALLHGALLGPVSLSRLEHRCMHNCIFNMQNIGIFSEERH